MTDTTQLKQRLDTTPPVRSTTTQHRQKLLAEPRLVCQTVVGNCDDHLALTCMFVAVLHHQQYCDAPNVELLRRATTPYIVNT
jgi:TorA maturation chaperone TorD